MRALVIDGNRNGLAVARALAAHGVEVHLAAPRRRPLARYSRAVTRTWLVPDPAAPGPFIAGISEIGARLADKDGLPLLLPVNDVYVVAFSRGWDRLESRFRPGFVTAPDALARLIEKDRCYALADEVGVPVPPRAASAEAYLVAGHPLPAVVKPAIRNAPELRGRPLFRARVCRDAAGLAAACAEVEQFGARPVIQMFVPGGDDALYTVGIAALQGRIVARFTGRKLRQFPPRIGEASFAESLPAPVTAGHAERLLGAAGFTGIAQVEFKRHDGVDYLMEVNPRSWSWIGLATASGVNLPAALADGALGRDGHAWQQRDGLTWMYVVEDARYHLWPRGKVGWVRWGCQALGAGTHAHWALNDPLPALAQFLPHLGIW